MSTEVASIEEERPKYEPILEEINAAFKAVFESEAIRTVEYTREERGEVFTITSDKLTRTYLRQPGQSFEELLRTVPHLPPDKNE
jgi:hypothetical protein